MHQFIGTANALRIGGNGSVVLIFTMHPPSKIKSLPSLITSNWLPGLDRLRSIRHLLTYRL
jgi:hypothetical protein